jgi:hypothetical protein
MEQDVEGDSGTVNATQREWFSFFLLIGVFLVKIHAA